MSDTTSVLTVGDVFAEVAFGDRIPFRTFDRMSDHEDAGVIDADTGRRFNYRELGNRSRQIADALRRHGVQPGDRVAWILPTGIDAIAVWMGIARIGAIDVGVGDALKGKMLEHVLTDSGSCVIIVHASMTAGLDGIDPEIRRNVRAVIVLDPAHKPTHANETALTLTNEWGGGPDDDASPQPMDPATIIYTSGTTGRSKGAVLCHHHQFFAGANYIEQFRIHKGATIYHYSPFNHVTGRQLVVAAMLSGSTLVMRARFSLDLF